MRNQLNCSEIFGVHYRNVVFSNSMFEVTADNEDICDKKCFEEIERQTKNGNQFNILYRPFFAISRYYFPVDRFCLHPPIETINREMLLGSKGSIFYYNMETMQPNYREFSMLKDWRKWFKNIKKNKNIRDVAIKYHYSSQLQPRKGINLIIRNN